MSSVVRSTLNGQKTYHRLLAPIVADHRSYGDRFWLPYLSGDVIVLNVAAPDGTQCCVEISAMWDDKSIGDIRVVALIDDGGWPAFVPVCDSFIIAPERTSEGV